MEREKRKSVKMIVSKILNMELHVAALEIWMIPELVVLVAGKVAKVVQVLLLRK